MHWDSRANGYEVKDEGGNEVVIPGSWIKERTEKTPAMIAAEEKRKEYVDE